MGNIWKVLKIEQTTDTRLIKKAYAKEVKDCHQEDEPERWMQLHAAYQHALAYAQGKENRRTEGEQKRADTKMHRQAYPEVRETEKKEENAYTELFDGIILEEKEKKKYDGVFPEFPKDKEYKYDDIMREFLAEEETQKYLGDIYFWKALEEYYSGYKSYSIAWAWVLEKQMEAERDRKLVPDEKLLVELEEMRERIWGRCVKAGGFLPKKMPKQPLKAAKLDNTILLIIGLLFFGFIGCVLYLLRYWLGDFLSGFLFG